MGEAVTVHDYAPPGIHEYVSSVPTGNGWTSVRPYVVKAPVGHIHSEYKHAVCDIAAIQQTRDIGVDSATVTIEYDDKEFVQIDCSKWIVRRKK